MGDSPLQLPKSFVWSSWRKMPWKGQGMEGVRLQLGVCLLGEEDRICPKLAAEMRLGSCYPGRQHELRSPRCWANSHSLPPPRCLCPQVQAPLPQTTTKSFVQRAWLINSALPSASCGRHRTSLGFLFFTGPQTAEIVLLKAGSGIHTVP